MPRDLRSSAGPTPETCSNWGDPMAPSLTTISLVAWTVRDSEPLRYVILLAAPWTKFTRLAMAFFSRL